MFEAWITLSIEFGLPIIIFDLEAQKYININQ